MRISLIIVRANERYLMLLRLKPANARWWNKPLAISEGRALPAELIVLKRSIRPNETGAWLNSRGMVSGVKDLIEVEPGKYVTVRCSLPVFVQRCLKNYAALGFTKGVYDLVIWNEQKERIRFVEVKCPQWDCLTKEQKEFAEASELIGIGTQIIEWQFE